MQNAIYGLEAKKKQKILGSRLFQVGGFFQHVNSTLIFIYFFSFACSFFCFVFMLQIGKKPNGFHIWSEFKFRPRFPLWLNSALGLDLACWKSHQLLWKIFFLEVHELGIKLIFFSGHLDNGRNTLRQKAMTNAKLCETVSVWFGFPKWGFKKKTKAIICLAYAGLVTHCSSKDNP